MKFDLEKVTKGNIIAAVLSLIVPGLGQAIQGRILLGLLQFILAAGLWIAFLGWLIHIWSVLDALFYQEKAS